MTGLRFTSPLDDLRPEETKAGIDRITAYGDTVIVEPVHERASELIELVQLERRAGQPHCTEPAKGVVRKVGPGRWAAHTAVRIAPPFAIGDLVLYETLGAIPLRADGVDYDAVSAAEVIAVCDVAG